MNVHEVTMDPEAAAKAFREYRAAFMADRNRIDGELMRGYKALAEGKTLISLTEAIQVGGEDELARPRLAIARADETQIQMQHDADGGLTYSPSWWTNIRAADRLFNFPAGTLTTQRLSTDLWTARLPFIPPQYRPPNAMTNYHLLWEAEWRKSASPQRKDPMLLRRIGGDLFAVVAAWDLTEIEKLVLAR